MRPVQLLVTGVATKPLLIENGPSSYVPTTEKLEHDAQGPRGRLSHRTATGAQAA